MAYRVMRSDKCVQDGARRIADEQIGRALGEIDADELVFSEKVHQVRKRCKKLRGLLRLVRPAFDDYGAENKAFRDAARLQSGVRDARTLIQTYDAVTSHFEEQIDRRCAFAPIREVEAKRGGFAAIGDGAGKTSKRARKRMQEAWQNRSDEAMHEWRKRVKCH